MEPAWDVPASPRIGRQLDEARRTRAAASTASTAPAAPAPEPVPRRMEVDLAGW